MSWVDYTIIGIILVGVVHSRAIITKISEAIIIRIRLSFICDGGAVIACIPMAVGILIGLVLI